MVREQYLSGIGAFGWEAGERAGSLTAVSKCSFIVLINGIFICPLPGGVLVGKNFMRKKITFILVIALFFFALGGILVFRGMRKSGSGASGASKPVAEIKLDQNAWLSALDSNGATTGDWLELTFTKAEKTKSVLIKGKSATAKNDKFFLVLYFEIKNDSDRPLFLFPVDLIRLVKADGKLFAPSVHQNLVEIRPISIKVSNVGFVVEKGEKDFILRVGEVGGEKKDVHVNF